MTKKPNPNRDLEQLGLSPDARRRCERLPHECLAFLGDKEEGERIVILRRGQVGYLQSRYDHPGLSADTARQVVREVNRSLGVKPSQAEALRAGCMHGWELPLTDPARYEDLDASDALAGLASTVRGH